MPSGGLKKTWLVAALTCVAVAAGVGSGVVGWVNSRHRATALEAGYAAYGERDWAAAEKVARDRLRHDRDDPEALRLLSRALFRQSNDQAASAISARLNQDTMTAEDLYLLGQACVRSRKADLAIKVWQKAVRLDPKHVDSHVALEQAFFRLDRLAEAEPEARALMAVPGREALGELMRGQICVEQSDQAGACEALERALDHPDEWQSLVDPVRVRKQAGRSLLQIGQPARARDRLLKLTGTARDGETCWLLVRCDLQESVASEPALKAQAVAYRESHPLEPEPAPFVGEARCARCHAEIFREYHQSRHSRTFFRDAQHAPVPFPPKPVTDPSHSRVSHTFEKTADGLKVRTRTEGPVFEVVVDYAFGSGDRGLTPVGHDADGRSLECRLSFYPDQAAWDVTSGQPLDADQPAATYAGRALTSDALRNCMDCHTTNPRSILTATGPESSDRAIGCEKCHGPGGNHLKVVSSPDFSAGDDVDLAIARAGRAAGPALIGLCAQCHSPPRNGPLLEPDAPSSIRFQGTTLTRSRCYVESERQLHCVTCHNPHRDAEKSSTWYESRCLRCHSPGQPTTNQPGGGTASSIPHSRAHPCPVQPASGCIPCHMPRRESTMAHTTFVDHYIRIHREPGPESKKSAPTADAGHDQIRADAPSMR